MFHARVAEKQKSWRVDRNATAVCAACTLCSYMYLLIHICVHMFGIAPSNFRGENARLSHSLWNSWAHGWAFCLAPLPEDSLDLPCLASCQARSLEPDRTVGSNWMRWGLRYVPRDFPSRDGDFPISECYEKTRECHRDSIDG